MEAGAGHGEGGKRKRVQETVEQRVRRIVSDRWQANGGEEARLREVWAEARVEGVSVREVGKVVGMMERAGELMERNGVLHKLT